MESLGITVTHSIVKRARSKMIEPNFRGLANFERRTPWWTGHKAEARPARLEALEKQHQQWLREEKGIERPFQTIDEIAGIYNQLFHDLNRRAHSGEGMEKVTPEGEAKMSPDEVWDSLIGDVIRGGIGRDTLLFMFRERRQVKVRHSQIKLFYHGKGFIYNPSADDDQLALVPFNGKTVEVAIDGLDLETIAVFYEGRLVCFGSNMTLRGMRAEDF